jgi:hypothetical protein
MALVAYSDSEGSGDEAPTAPKSNVTKAAPIAKTESRKIKVDLPSLPPETSPQDAGEGEQPPAKRARTAGAFGGFNSLLPAPKRAAASAPGLKKGVSLKTSSEAAFSRMPPPSYNEDGDGVNEEMYDEFGNRAQGLPTSTPTAAATTPDEDKSSKEVKIIGKATRFKPLSVANISKRKPSKKSVAPPVEPVPESISSQTNAASVRDVPVAEAQPEVKPKKKSLFSVEHDAEAVPDDPDDEYQAQKHTTASLADVRPSNQTISALAAAPGSLESVAADLNLTPGQRRQLFGRHAKDIPANITNFNLDDEYRANEEIRHSGETMEHRAVKTIAPGKHSLQQLVNNARSNQDSIEDKWAEGRRNRGEAGSKYGWGKG